MSFSFGFDLSEADGNDTNNFNADSEKFGDAQQQVKPSVSDDAVKDESSSREHLLAFGWIDNVNDLLARRRQDQIIYDEIPIHNGGGDDDNDPPTTSSTSSTATLRRVDLTRSTFDPAAVTTKPGESPAAAANDLIPGVYEGGLKVWESSLDLVEYMHAKPALALPFSSFSTTTTTSPCRRIKCLELGCGHGLPLCYILRQAIERNCLPQTQVIAVDYNDYVLRDAFLSNVLLNIDAAVTDDKNNEMQIDNAYDQLAQCLKMGAGDWYGLLQEQQQGSSLSSCLAHQMDWIAATETLYSVQAAHETAVLIARLLRPDTGRAWVASKRYYFGVGGGVDAFRQAAAALQGNIHYNGSPYRLDVQTMSIFDNGKANIRELLRVQLTKET